MACLHVGRELTVRYWRAKAQPYRSASRVLLLIRSRFCLGLQLLDSLGTYLVDDAPQFVDLLTEPEVSHASAVGTYMSVVRKSCL